MPSCFTDPYATFKWMCCLPKCIFCELCLPPTGAPVRRLYSETQRRRGMARVPLCSPNPYASFEVELWPSKMIIFCELCHPTTGTPGGRRNSEIRLQGGLAREP